MSLVTDAAHWYASGTFWSAAGVGVTLLVGLAALAVAYIVGYPKRRLTYTMWTATPMLAALEGIRGDLELRHRGRLLLAPHVIDIHLACRGRKDIPSSAYDQDQPVRLDLGAPIVEILQIKSYPESSQSPTAVIDGTFLKIGPSLISKRQQISFVILTDGPKYSLNCHNTLIDVEIQRRTIDQSTGRQLSRTIRQIAFIALVAVGLMEAALTVAHPNGADAPLAAKILSGLSILSAWIIGVIAIRAFRHAGFL